jgi:predicted house-cleaning noncanonical NTP pyrophosphatase (MazG superfamily)
MRHRDSGEQRSRYDGTMRVDKLVRDNVPRELTQLGRRIIVEWVAGDEYLRRLKEKLLEEAAEVIRSDESLEELADVLEVVIALATFHGQSLDALLATASAKRSRLGGFTTGTVLVDNGLPEPAPHPAPRT